MAKSLLAPWMAWALLQDGRAQLIDLRGRDEIDLPRIPGGRAIPLDELPSELATLDRERPVVFVSATGRKAVEAMRALRFGRDHGLCRGGWHARVARGRTPDRERRR
jgi:rhodanese-related sulfurtransferase